MSNNYDIPITIHRHSQHIYHWAWGTVLKSTVDVNLLIECLTNHHIKYGAVHGQRHFQITAQLCYEINVKQQQRPFAFIRLVRIVGKETIDYESGVHDGHPESTSSQVSRLEVIIRRVGKKW